MWLGSKRYAAIARIATGKGRSRINQSIVTSARPQVEDHRGNMRVCTGSVIADIGTNLSAEDPIRPTRINKDDRQQEERANHKECLRAWRRRGLPKRVVVRDDQGPQTDRDACVGHSEQPDGTDEGSGLRCA